MNNDTITAAPAQRLSQEQINALLEEFGLRLPEPPASRSGAPPHPRRALFLFRTLQRLVSQRRIAA